MIFTLVLLVLTGAGIAWFWNYAYTPQGLARTVFCEVRHDGKGLRAWMLQHGLIKPEVYTKILEDKRLNAEKSARLAAWAGDIPDYDGLAVKKLVEIGSEAWPVVAEAIKDKDRGVQCVAIDTCVQLKDTRAVGPLVEMLRDESLSQAVRRQCASVLGELQSEQAVPSLEATLKDKDSCLRSEAAIALAKLNDGRAVSVLLEAIKKDEGYRETAAGALMKLGRNEGFEFLVAEIRDSKNRSRYKAAQALGDWGDHRAVRPLIRVLDEPCDDEYVRRHVAEPRETLYRARLRLQHAHLAAASALGKLGDARAIPALRKLLADPDKRVHDWAVYALKQMGIREDYYSSTQPATAGAP
jgi:HEAT repeat protein